MSPLFRIKKYSHLRGCVCVTKMLCCVCKKSKGSDPKEDLSDVKVFTYMSNKQFVQRMYCSEKCFDECQEFYTLKMECLECCMKPEEAIHSLAIQYPENGNYIRYRAMCSLECKLKATQKASLVEEIVKLCLVCRAPAPKQCSLCHLAYYCSAECQKNHWFAIHKTECKKLKE